MAASTDHTPTAIERLGPVDVVIRFDGQAVGHLHATLAGVRHMFDVQRIAVVTSRIEVATKAVGGTGAVVVEADPNDATRLRAAADFGQAPFVALFDAGDVPQPGYTGALRSEFADPTVAVVQACLAPDGVDSAERDARGRHELRFEREVLNPSLGARRGAVLLGSGAMMRRTTLRDVSVPRGARRSAELRWSIKVRAAGLALLAPARPIVSAASVNTDHAVGVARRGEVRAVVATMLSRHDPLWSVRLTLSHRSGYLAWMVRPLSGLRRLAFLGVLLACIVTGSSPVRPQSSAWIVAGLWAGWFALQGLAVQQCSDGVLQIGDRARWSMRTMGASIAALFGAGRPAAGPTDAPMDAGRDGSWRGAGPNPFLVVALFGIATIALAMCVDRWRHFLPDAMTDDVDDWTKAGVAVVMVWTVAVMLDVMRCLVGGPQLRAHQRLRVRLDATVDGNAARMMNLSPRGASVSFDDDADLIVGDQVTMQFLVPTGSGTNAEVATIATVRSARVDVTDRGPTLVCGVEFGAMDRVSADALFAFCSVVQPDGLVLEGPAEQQLAAELVAGPVLPQRLTGVRLLGLLALVGIGATMMPPYGESAAVDDADPHSSITVRLVNSRTGEGVEGAGISATCVASARVVDDGDQIGEVERAAVDTTRAQLLARVARAAEDAAERDLRRETPPSKQAEQHARWLADQQGPPAGTPSSSTSQFVASAAGWHRMPAVAIGESTPIVATDAGDGTYVVNDLPGWPCRVEATGIPAGYVAAAIGPAAGDLVQFADGGDIVRMAVVPGAVATDPVIEIGDRVWVDADGDGLQGPSEPGLEGVTVTLTADGSEHAVVTDQSGGFRFSNDSNGISGVGVAAGITELRVGATVQIQAPPTLDLGTETFHLTAVGAGSATTPTAPPTPTASPTATVTPIAPVVTPTTAVTPTTDGGALVPRPTIDSSVDPGTGQYTFSIQSAAGGLIDHSIDIGYTQAHALGDRVWLDADNDGLMSSGEQGIDGVTVLLYVDQAGDGMPDGLAVDAQITTEGGFYDFEGLPAGGYVVEVHPPDGMVSSTGSIGRSDGPYEPAGGSQTSTAAITATATATTAAVTDVSDDGTMLATGVIRSTAITLGSTGASSSAGDSTVDFGLFPARSIDDAVWLDEDGDGVLSSDEPGLAGVPMVLLRGDEVLAITSTDAEGDFVFPNLTLGEYTVQIHAPPGLRPIDALPPLTDEGELIGDPQAAPDPSTAGSEPGTDAATVTTLDPALDALDGTIDGVFNGVIEGSAANTAPAETTTTNDPDDPSVDEPELTVQPTAAAPADDPAFEVVEVSVAPDWAGADAGRALQRFGLWAPRSIGHMVWEDADDDGAIDAGEAGIPGIEVRLLEGDRVVARTLSAVDGTYRFVDLPEGTYRISVDLPATWRTSSIGWDDPTAAVTGIDNGLPTRATKRAVGPPIRIGRVDVNARQSFEHANIGMFQPRPTVALAASVRGCAPSSATGADGQRGTCIGTESQAAPPAPTGGEPTTGGEPGGPSTDPAEATVSDNNPIVVAGSTITFDYLVSNTGNVPMSGLTVADDVVTADDIDCNGSADGNGQPLLLEVGHSVTCTTAGRVTAGQGRRTATVTASAESAPGTVAEIQPVADTTYWFGSAPGLTTRTFVTTVSPGVDANGDGELDAAPTRQVSSVDDADRPAADATAVHVVADGTKVWWVYEVHNTGAVPLSEVNVIDQQRGPICGGLVLAPGEHRFCVAPATLTRAGSDSGRHRALSSVTAVDGSDPSKRVPVGPVGDAAHAFVVRPQLEVAVSIDGTPAPPTSLGVVSGATVELSYSITNSGDVAYEFVALSDAFTGLIDCPELNVGRGGLEPGETVICTVRRQLQAAPPAANTEQPDATDTAEGLPLTVETLVRAEGQPAAVEGGTLATVIVETTWSYTASSLAAGDEAFVDTDGDAQRDPDEAPMADVEVRLLDDTQQVVVTGTTDVDGRWGFTSLPPGVYSIEYVVPDGFAVAMSAPSGIRIVQPDPDTGTVVTDPVLIDDPSDVPSWPLALVQLASISDDVWLDSDADGLRGPSEPGVSSVSVSIVDAGGATVGRTATDTVGRWSFEALPPGAYTVSVVAPDGYRVHRLGADAAVTQTVSLQLVSPGIDSTGTVGVWITPVSRIEDRVWNDADGDGALADGERGRARVIVTLVRVEAGVGAAGVGGGPGGTDGGDDGVAVPVAVTTTDSIGRFAFQAVPPGDYVVALGAVVEGTPIASLLTVEPDGAATNASVATSTSTSAAAAEPALRTGASARAVTVNGSPSISPDLSLAVTPANRARIAPGRALIEPPSLLDPADLVPTTGAEWGQTAVFVACMMVFSTVVATTRRRQLR